MPFAQSANTLILFLIAAKDTGKFQWTIRRFITRIVSAQRLAAGYIKCSHAQREAIALKWDKVRALVKTNPLKNHCGWRFVRAGGCASGLSITVQVDQPRVLRAAKELYQRECIKVDIENDAIEAENAKRKLVLPVTSTSAFLGILVIASHFLTELLEDRCYRCETNQTQKVSKL